MRRFPVTLFCLMLAPAFAGEPARLTGLSRWHGRWLAAVWFPDSNYGFLLPEGEGREGWRLQAVDLRHQAVTIESPDGPVRLTWSGRLDADPRDPDETANPGPPPPTSRVYHWESLVTPTGLGDSERQELLALLASPAPAPRSRPADDDAVRHLRLILAGQPALPVRVRLMNELAAYRRAEP